MNDVSEIVFAPSMFRDEVAMYEELGRQIHILTETGNAMTIAPAKTLDGESLVVLRFAHFDNSSPFPYWLYEDEAEAAAAVHDENEAKECREFLSGGGDSPGSA